MSTPANRYDSKAYLEAYRDNKTFPRIHDDMVGLVRRYAPAGAVLDLCCSTGLLGQRLIDELGMHAVGVEGFVASHRDGPKYGVTMPIMELRISAETLPQLLNLIQEHQVRTIVARRCIIDLWPAPDDPFGELFVTSVIDRGVRNVFLQGRQVSSRTSGPMRDVDGEMAAFARHMRVIEHHGQFAVLSLDELKLQADAVDWSAV